MEIGLLIMHRELIESKGILPLIVNLLNVNQLRLLVLIELYLLSSDSKLRNAFADTDCPRLVKNINMTPL